MALHEVDGAAGAPWARPLEGRLDQIVVHSELLEDNPLGDSPRRPLYVYSSPGVAAGRAADVPVVYVIQGYSGQVDMWLSRSGFEPTIVERLDALWRGGETPEGIVVFVDAWTSLGGSQFLNSTSTGRYLDYLCDEVPAFVDARYPTAGDRDHRALAGKSSGGYGAMVVPMLRPDVFGAFASHAGDALFEYCYLIEFPAIARTLRDDFGGSFDALIEAARTADPFDWSRFGAAFSLYAYGAAYTPDPDRPGRALMPLDPRSGRVVEEVWQRWLELDPVRMAPRHGEALRSMRRIYLDAGRADEFFLDVGACAFAGELEKLGVAHTLELFEGTHSGIAWRYPIAIHELMRSLAA